MTDTARRKDLIYPAVNDAQTLNSAQFDSDSTPSPTHHYNGMLSQKTPITIDVATGFSSEEEGANVVQMLPNCGKAELNKESSDQQLTGKYIELPMSEVDERIQSTYSLFTKHASKSLPRQKAASVCLANTDVTSEHRSMSNHTSPSHSYLSPSRNIVRCASPEIGGGRIYSNPFFVQDRLSRSNLERQRLDSAPTKMNLRINDTNEIRSQSSASVHPTLPSSLSMSKSFSHTTGSSVRDSANALNSVNIQSRIKLWAEKEKEAKETKELERIRSPSSQKSNSSSPQRNHSNTPPKVFDLISRPKSPIKIVESPEVTSQEQRKYSSTTISSSTTSSTTASPSRSPIKGKKSRLGNKDSSSEHNSDASPKRSRWKLKSPLFGRKKASDSLSVDSEQSDENTLSGSNEKLDKKTHKISSRTNHKRKAVKKRLSSALGMARSHSEEHAIMDDQAIPTSKPPLPDRQRSHSVGPKQRIRTNRQRASSQPDIRKNEVNMPEFEGDYMIVRSKRLDPETQTVIGNSSLPNESFLSTVVLRGEKGRQNTEAKTKTISRDIRDIIDCLGTSRLAHGESDPTMSLVNESVRSPELQCGLELTPSESQLDVVIQHPVGSGPPGLFSDDEEAFLSSKCA